MKQQPVILIIMDGWGLAEDPAVSAIEAAQTPFYDEAMARYPNIRLEASGLAVGLPEGQMGNSEVGHMNIGAGRVVYQDLVRINREISSRDFLQNEEVKKLLAYCEDQQKPLHLLGLLSDGGVHSSIHHLTGILEMLKEASFPIYVHAFMDGRDTDPRGGLNYVRQLQAAMDEHQCGKIASLVGRYYAMDRDKRWPRVKKAYDLLVHGQGEAFASAEEAVAASYEADITDEFMEPRLITEQGTPVATLQPDDAVLFFNFRTDRGRQLTHVLTQQDMPEEGMQRVPLYYATMTRYDDTFQDIHVLYEKEQLVNGLGEHLAKLGKTQLRIAETEKYPHVTFFFNGGREKPMEGEVHALCPSPKVATYDLQPEMSANDIREQVIEQIEQQRPDFICLNFANPDMVGHTGVFEAAVTACETVDECTRAVVEAAVAKGYACLITADHGNSDRMRNPDGSPHTAHTLAEVPLILVAPKGDWQFSQEKGKLGDLAPSILKLMQLPLPEEMTGDVLVKEKEPTG